MNDATEMMSIVGVRVPDFVVIVLLILSGLLGYLIDKRLAGWIAPVRLMAGLAIMSIFGAVVASIIFAIMVQIYGPAPGWSPSGVAMVIASGTGEVAAGGGFVILVIRFVMPVLALTARIWDRISPHLRVKSPE